MRLNSRRIILACGVANATIALYHIGFFFIAGLVRGLFGGNAPHPGLPPMALAVAALFAIFAAYTFSGAGVIRRLTLLKPGLAVPATIYTLYGLALLLQRGSAVSGSGAPDWEYAISGGIIGVGILALGIAHIIGMLKASPRAKVTYGLQ